ARGKFGCGIPRFPVALLLCRPLIQIGELMRLMDNTAHRLRMCAALRALQNDFRDSFLAAHTFTARFIIQRFAHAGLFGWVVGLVLGLSRQRCEEHEDAGLRHAPYGATPVPWRGDS